MAIGTSEGLQFENEFDYQMHDLGLKNLSQQGGEDQQTNVQPSQGQQEASNGNTRSVSIIRHGATKLNNDDVSVDRIRGWSDIPLSKEGREEAQKLAESLKGKAPDVLLTSDLHRARETAHIISKATGVPVAEETQGFRPWNVGDFAGQVSKEAVPVLADYAANKPDEKVPGGESFNEFKGRFLGALNDALEKHDGNVGIVTHHRGERLMKAWEATDYDPSGDIDKKVFAQKGEPTGAVHRLEVPHDNVKMAGEVLPMGKEEGLHTGPTNQSADYAWGLKKEENIKPIPIDTMHKFLERSVRRPR